MFVVLNPWAMRSIRFDRGNDFTFLSFMCLRRRRVFSRLRLFRRFFTGFIRGLVIYGRWRGGLVLIAKVVFVWLPPPISVVVGLGLTFRGTRTRFSRRRRRRWCWSTACVTLCGRRTAWLGLTRLRTWLMVLIGIVIIIILGSVTWSSGTTSSFFTAWLCLRYLLFIFSPWIYKPFIEIIDILP